MSRAGRQDRVDSAEEIHTTVRSDGVWLFIIIQRSPGTSPLPRYALGLLTNTRPYSLLVQAVNEALTSVYLGASLSPGHVHAANKACFFQFTYLLISTVDRATPNATPLTDPCTDPHC